MSSIVSASSTNRIFFLRVIAFTFPPLTLSLGRFERTSRTHVQSSPLSSPDIKASQNANLCGSGRDETQTTCGGMSHYCLSAGLVNSLFDYRTQDVGSGIRQPGVRIRRYFTRTIHSSQWCYVCRLCIESALPVPHFSSSRLRHHPLAASFREPTAELW